MNLDQGHTQRIPLSCQNPVSFRQAANAARGRRNQTRFVGAGLVPAVRRGLHERCITSRCRSNSNVEPPFRTARAGLKHGATTEMGAAPTNLTSCLGQDLPIWLMYPHADSGRMFMEVTNAKLNGQSLERTGKICGRVSNGCCRCSCSHSLPLERSPLATGHHRDGRSHRSPGKTSK